MISRLSVPLSGALQGALVANYPWDGTNDESTRYEACPDDAAFKHLASVYASNHQTMALANNTVRPVLRVVPAGCRGLRWGSGGRVRAAGQPPGSGAGNDTRGARPAGTLALLLLLLLLLHGSALLLPLTDSSAGGPHLLALPVQVVASPCDPGSAVQEFPNGGTTNGAAWYPIYGSMQVGRRREEGEGELVVKCRQETVRAAPSRRHKLLRSVLARRSSYSCPLPRPANRTGIMSRRGAWS